MDGTTPETCAECGFDSRDWRLRDAVTLFSALGYWWRLATAGASDEDLNHRPAPNVWSAMEYGQHTAFVTPLIRRDVELILAEDGCTLPPMSQDEVAAARADKPVSFLEPGPLLECLEREGAELAAVAESRAAAWGNIGWLSGRPIQAEADVIHATHDASHHFMDVSRGLASLGAGTPSGSGVVTQVNASDGGVPKRSIEGGHVGRRGLEGDRQADGKHHGRPFQALCLWSADVIAELAADGYPVAAGCAGENVTLSGIDWASLRPGVRIRVGTALVELSYPAVPCNKQAQWFTDGDFSRLSHERHPEWVRWYGWVRQPGRVTRGDEVAVQP